MKRNMLRTPKSFKIPLAWREAEYAALQASSADTFEDRVTEDIFDIEDERAEVDNIVHNFMHDAN